jgi:1A family penicillin-binding protein
MPKDKRPKKESKQKSAEINSSNADLELKDKKNSKKIPGRKKAVHYLLGTLKFFAYLLATLVTTSILAGFIAVVGVYLAYAPSFKEAKPRSNVTQNVFYDKNGDVIYQSFGAAKPEVVKIQDIPDLIKKATLAAEDEDFYKHGAIDIKGIARAAYGNLKDSNKSGLSKLGDLLSEENYTQGGSTITQQLVKNQYLTTERSFNRKIKEIIYSIELERTKSKDQIFEDYLNNVYYGEQALGIKNAAKRYFNKDIKDLDLAEISMLVGLPAAPTRLSPISGDFKESKKRQEYVLSKMYYAGFINMDQAKAAANQSLYFADASASLTLKYPFYVDYIKKELVEKLGQDAVEAGGLSVYTSLDPAKQKLAEEKAANFIKKNRYRKASNAAVVILDNKNGTVAGLVGGVDWEESKVNIALSPRQPGSSFKPIVYSAALQNGYTAGTVLWDTYVNFGGNPPYTPRNYDGSYHGYLTVRKALANSLNIPAVEMTKLVGIEKVIENAKKLGITSINNSADSYGLSIGLGAAEVSPFEMARAYSAIANSGKQYSFSGIIKVKNQKDEEIYKPQKLAKEVMDPKVAYIMSSIMSDNEARSMVFGRNNPLTLKDRPVGAKTGTTDDFADSWTIGFTPQYTVATWVGNNDRTKMARVSGFEGAAYIWQDVMKGIHKGLAVEQFQRAAGTIEVWINPRTGALAKRQIRPYYKEVFIVGTEPKDKQKIDLSYLDQFRTYRKKKTTN